MNMRKWTSLLILFLFGCAIQYPLFYSSKPITSDELESFFDEDSAVVEMQYFNACVEEFVILPVENWREIKSEGVVIVKALVEENGELSIAAITQSVHPTLDSIALNSVIAATFKPASRIVNHEGEYFIQFVIPFYESAFNPAEFSILNNLKYGEKMYDIPPEPVEGWSHTDLNIHFSNTGAIQAMVGEVNIIFNIDSQGGIGEFYVSKAFGNGAEEKAIAAIRRVKWQPAMKDGQPVPSAVEIPFQFHYYY